MCEIDFREIKGVGNITATMLNHPDCLRIIFEHLKLKLFSCLGTKTRCLEENEENEENEEKNERKEKPERKNKITCFLTMDE